jgi:L-2-amino-thiazoline-4-carboxylic acid hydrolase
MDGTPGSIKQCEEALVKSRRETRDAFENRALMYWYIYDELASEVGADRATTIMKQAVFRRGLEVGRKYRAAAESGDLAEVGAIFCEGSPSEGELFSPAIEALDDDRLVLRMESCPLVDAWRTIGLAPEEIDRMCEISAAVDQGTFAGAGLSLEFLDRLGKPGSCRCLLELKPPAAEG